MTNKYKKCPFCEQNIIPQKVKFYKCGKRVDRIRYVKDNKNHQVNWLSYRCEGLKNSKNFRLDENYQYIRMYNLGLS